MSDLNTREKREERSLSDSNTRGKREKKSRSFLSDFKRKRSMSDEKDFLQPAIPRFHGHYDHWSMLMENLLRSKGLWSLVENGLEEPRAGTLLTDAQQTQLECARVNDLKVKNYLFQSIDRVILEQILEKRTSKQIWDSMKRKFEGNARVKRSLLQTLRRDFEVLEMKIGETITDYFARVMTIANKMRSNGEQMRDVTIVEKILRTLTNKFNYVVVSIEESKDIDSITIDELQSSLLVHEQKFNRNNGEEQALKVTYDEDYMEEDVEEQYSEMDEAEEGVARPTTRQSLNATNAISLDTISTSVQL